MPCGSLDHRARSCLSNIDKTLIFQYTSGLLVVIILIVKEQNLARQPMPQDHDTSADPAVIDTFDVADQVEGTQVVPEEVLSRARSEVQAQDLAEHRVRELIKSFNARREQFMEQRKALNGMIRRVIEFFDKTHLAMEREYLDLVDLRTAVKKAPEAGNLHSDVLPALDALERKILDKYKLPEIPAFGSTQQPSIELQRNIDGPPVRIEQQESQTSRTMLIGEGKSEKQPDTYGDDVAIIDAEKNTVVVADGNSSYANSVEVAKRFAIGIHEAFTTTPSTQDRNALKDHIVKHLRTLPEALQELRGSGGAVAAGARYFPELQAAAVVRVGDCELYKVSDGKVIALQRDNSKETVITAALTKFEGSAGKFTSGTQLENSVEFISLLPGEELWVMTDGPRNHADGQQAILTMIDRLRKGDFSSVPNATKDDIAITRLEVKTAA